MLTMIWVVAVMYGLAVILDQVMTDKHVQAWRKTAKVLHREVENLDGIKAVKTAHRMFCGLFDAIYGNKYWSWKRVRRSYVSSLIALAGITLLLGWETTKFGGDELVGENSTVEIIGLLIGIFVLNTLADYISLQETRWVLGEGRIPGVSRIPGVGSLFVLAVVDLVATAAIWYGIMAIIYVLWHFASGVSMDLGAAINRDVGLPFFLSTFFTSAAWWLYLLSVVVIRLVMRQSRVFGFLLDAIAESGSPARMTITILSILAGALYGISIGVVWLVQTAI